MRKLTVLLTAIALVFAAMPSALANDTDFVRAEWEGGGMPVFDPETVAARCPSGFQWILQTFGSGVLNTDVYEGDFTLTGDHCSRWLRDTPDTPDRWFLGRVGDGVMTMTTPVGDLVVTYAGIFTFKGDTTIPDFTSKVFLRYRVDGDGSTGVFAGASGRGILLVNDDTGYETGRLFGTITLDD